MSITLFAGIGHLPLFNPDSENLPPAVVKDFLSSVAEADALLIASPEYAHGVTGAIKNALDWLVGFEPFAGKLVAVLNASPRAHHADEALRETLKTMAAAIDETASVAIPVLGACSDEDAMVSTPAIAGAIEQALKALHAAACLRKTPSNT
jgi:NAD(P)H-dependent FMN reductase